MNQTAFTKTKECLLQSLQYSFPIRRLNISEYHRMGEEGILSEDERVELIDGVIIQMSPKGTKHTACIRKLTNLLPRLLYGQALVSIQDPIILNDDTELEPDIAAVKPHDDAYVTEHPRPDDVLFLIEAADTSLDYDKEIKLPRYANSDIKEVWIVNLVEDIIEVYREPLILADGTADYRTRIDFVKGDTIAPKALPSLKIAVDDVLV